MNIRKSLIQRHTALCLFGTAVLLLSVILCIGIGPVNIPFNTVWRIMFYEVFGAGNVQDIPDHIQKIVWHLRAPRVLLGAMVGTALSLSGVAMQAFTKNPLANPYVLGISSGASFGAVLTMATGALTVLGAFKVQIGAFAGAMGAILLVYLLSRSGRTVTPIKLILVGVAVSAMFSAFTNFTIYNAPDDAKVREATFWMLGGVAGVKWAVLPPLFAVLLPGFILLFMLSGALNAMMMGDDAAVTLGVDVQQVRKWLIVITALLTGLSVSAAGCIGFVGLIIPHLVRAATGSDHRRVIPLAALSGGIYLIWIDVGARMLDIPKEIPIGILTAMIGAPFFLWMIRARRYAFGDQK